MIKCVQIEGVVRSAAIIIDADTAENQQEWLNAINNEVKLARKRVDSPEPTISV